MSSDMFMGRWGAWKQAEGRADALARAVADELLNPGAWRRPSSVIRVKEALAKYERAVAEERVAWAEFQAHVEVSA